jgi:hypothetical protein
MNAQLPDRPHMQGIAKLEGHMVYTVPMLRALQYIGPSTGTSGVTVKTSP